MTATVLVPEIWGNGKTKDYPLWYWAGQQVLEGGDLYKRLTRGTLDFIYLPLPAMLFAIPAYFGKIPLYLSFSLLNAASWWIAAQLSNAMAGSGKLPGPWLAALPSILMLPFVFDNFDLGQPNLILLALMLVGFWWLPRRPWAAGGMFALAAVIKVFPVAVFPYLLWRRRWAAAASMGVFLAAFLFVVPAPVRGYERNLSELSTWYRGMVASSSEQGFGQRNEQNWSWVNQSIVAVTHRILRPVNYDQDNAAAPPRYVNLFNLDFKTANWILLALSGLIGLGFVAAMPRQSDVTPRSNAEELGILFSLMTVASPLAREYYFVWLIFPMTVLVHRAAFDPRHAVRVWTRTVLGLAMALLALSLPVFPRVIQAAGNNLVATALIAAALAWQMRHPPSGNSQPISAP